MHQHGGSGERERPRETDGQRARGQRARAGARIFAVVAQVDDAVHGHGPGARPDHGDDDPRDLPPRRPARRRAGDRRIARGEQGSCQRKRQREHGVFELDHFEDGADARRAQFDSLNFSMGRALQSLNGLPRSLKRASQLPNYRFVILRRAARRRISLLRRKPRRNSSLRSE